MTVVITLDFNPLINWISALMFELTCLQAGMDAGFQGEGETS